MSREGIILAPFGPLVLHSSQIKIFEQTLYVRPSCSPPPAYVRLACSPSPAKLVVHAQPELHFPRRAILLHHDSARRSKYLCHIRIARFLREVTLPMSSKLLPLVSTKKNAIVGAMSALKIPKMM